MKYTERFFKFPIRYIDQFKVMKIGEEYNKNQSLPDEEPVIPSVDCIYKLPYDEIRGWSEEPAPEDLFEDIESKGFKCTMVFTKTHGDLLCSWSVKKFEEKLDAFEEKITDWYKEMKKSDSNSIQEQKV